jgi:pimeloyl-ACP methyl ester carboxylesterase
MEVHLWHGDDDASIPLSVGQHVAGAIPSCRATTLAGEGHFLLFDHWRDILAAMVS